MLKCLRNVYSSDYIGSAWKLHEIFGLDANILTFQDIPVIPEIEPSQNPSSVTVETKGTAESDRAGGEFPKGSTSTQKEMQKKWTCALCLVTTTSKKDLNSHLTGRKHRDTIEALSIAKKQPTLKKQKDAEGTNEIIATDNKEILKVKF